MEMVSSNGIHFRIDGDEFLLEVRKWIGHNKNSKTSHMVLFKTETIKRFPHPYYGACSMLDLRAPLIKLKRAYLVK